MTQLSAPARERTFWEARAFEVRAEALAARGDPLRAGACYMDAAEDWRVLGYRAWACRLLERAQLAYGQAGAAGRRPMHAARARWERLAGTERIPEEPAEGFDA